MVKSILLSSLVAVATAAAIPGNNREVCGSRPPSQEFLASVKKSRLAERALMSSAIVARGDIVIQTYVHIVSENTTLEGGNASDEIIEEQMEVLNEGLKGTGFAVELMGTDRTVNALWNVDGENDKMMRTLRKGTYKDLNLYYLKTPEGDPRIGGYCNYPVKSPNSTVFLQDGCVNRFDSLPGLSTSTNDTGTGKITVHETGHWLGLLHTFEGGCNVTTGGDLVDDTPYHLEPTTWSDSLCPTENRMKTCPNLPGFDPVNNYMNYKIESCMTEFTPGQAGRMKTLWSYRDPEYFSLAMNERQLQRTRYSAEPNVTYTR